MPWSWGGDRCCGGVEPATAGGGEWAGDSGAANGGGEWAGDSGAANGGSAGGGGSAVAGVGGCRPWLTGCHGCGLTGCHGCWLTGCKCWPWWLHWDGVVRQAS